MSAKLPMQKVAGFSFAAALLAGCSGGGLTGAPGLSASASTSTGSAPGFTERIARFFDSGGSAKPQQEDGAPPPPEDIDCPDVTVRQGASTYRISAPGEPSAMTVKYQGTIARTARDCHVAGSSLVMKVGVEGRLILGPAGQPGTVNVPLRIAVVHEGPNPKTITTKSYQIPVTIPPGSGNVPFFEVDDQIAFPLVHANELAHYVVYIGFDPEAKTPAKKPKRRKRKNSA